MKILTAMMLFTTLSAHGLTLEQNTDLNNFVEGIKPVTNIYSLEKMNIRNVMLPEDKSPWSGSFWPDRAGSIAVKYTNSSLLEKIKIVFGASFAKKQFENRHENMDEKLMSMTDEELSKLSPSEKYDLIMGDTDFTFSRQLLKRVDHIKGYSDGLAFWSGICHGWAPASIHMPRPKHEIRLPILEGKRLLTIYPEDLKALGSFLWASKANNDDNMKFSGNRCNIGTPRIDSRTDLVKPLKNPTRQEDECADTDPVTFHLVTLNRLGIQKKSFIADVDYNAVVNNHPIAGYEVKYFNPATGKYTTFKNAHSTISKLFADPLKDLRNKKAKYVIGVEMNLIVSNWIIPKKEESDSYEKDEHQVRKYIYQLEVDAKGNIVGGHWRTRLRNQNHSSRRSKPAIEALNRPSPAYPDFFWDHSDNFIPSEYYTYVSSGLTLNLEAGLDKKWITAAVMNSNNSMKLLNSTRIRHSISRSKKLDKKARQMAKELGIADYEAADKFESIMDKLNVPKEKENPQVISSVIYKLFYLAQ